MLRVRNIMAVSKWFPCQYIQVNRFISGCLPHHWSWKKTVIILLGLTSISLILIIFHLSSPSTYKSRLSSWQQHIVPNTKDFRDPQQYFPKQRNIHFSRYELNVSRSNELPILRTIPDTRPDDCLKENNYDVSHLPSVSIIIPFHNEAWSMLLRTVASAYFRLPEELLHSIILVDDVSSYKYLIEPLQKYISNLPKVHLIRNKKREGLIRSRNIGARAAHAQVLVFLDAHTECNQDWLLPLIREIKRNHKTLAVPHIDVLNTFSLDYESWVPTMYGTFAWDLQYVWKRLPDDVLKSKPTKPISTPTMIGCAFAIDRNYFFQLGQFDEGMYIWGGENLELPFRVWMCGGRVVIVPCSRVGHVFRKILPFSFPPEFGGTSVIKKNYMRVANIWMDQYRMFYYATVNDNPVQSLADISSERARKALYKQLHCRDFSWFLTHVAVDVVVPSMTSMYHGQLRSMESQLCITINQQDNLLHMSDCSYYYPQQMFSYTKNKQLILNRYDTYVAAIWKPLSKILLTRNSTSQADWIFNRHSVWTGTFINEDKYKFVGRLEVRQQKDSPPECLTQLNKKGEQIVDLTPCENREYKMARFQYWSITYQLHW